MERPTGIISLSGKDYPTWGFVLNKAHEMGLLGIETTLIQVPTDANGKTAIVQAVATFAPISEGGPPRQFSGLGDAGPHNVGPKIAGATLRMAETRAMGRALRTATNIGLTMYEELGEMEDRDEARPVATPARARTAEVLERNERPLEVEPPGGKAAPGSRLQAPGPNLAPGAWSLEPTTEGFEERYVEGTQTFVRKDLVGYATRSLSQAMRDGVKVEPIVPHQATNAQLVAWGRTVRPLLSKKALKEEAAV